MPHIGCVWNGLSLCLHMDIKHNSNISKPELSSAIGVIMDSKSVTAEPGTGGIPRRQYLVLVSPNLQC